MPVGSKITLGLLRDGKPVTVNLELQQSSQTQVDSSSIFKGIEGADMSNKGQDKGVVVSDVKPNSPAADRPEERGCDYRCESAAGEKHRRTAQNPRQQTRCTGAEHSAR
jgi:S1-C subfamily serine protease